MQVFQLQSTLPRSEVDTSAVLFLLFALTFWNESTARAQTRESLGWNFSSCSLWVIKSGLCRCFKNQLLLSQSVDAIEDHVTSCCGFSARTVCSDKHHFHCISGSYCWFLNISIYKLLLFMTVGWKKNSSLSRWFISGVCKVKHCFYYLSCLKVNTKMWCITLMTWTITQILWLFDEKCSIYFTKR